ncbi:hypothetical protein VFPPC_07925 [Pochonia chlamydosporia 170]|uniref:Uncharacterized protein n=1 Tax=Pochonia chlamydosporia 170 TaxID=1380566 RepID=A0A179FL45_METCM|nr:hypothetical protein VFPPC_07925 [Pochonia chlamydosporia 170]OAQ66356.1 hypothetical protein VFPPC_07925 [Pochonia chlamydosporia 170]
MFHKNWTHGNVRDQGSRDMTVVTGGDDINPRPRKLSKKADSFLATLGNTFPAALVPDDLAEAFKHNANERLRLAKQQGIKLEEIYIGEDCLPSWRTLYWDPTDKSLHSAIQERLLHLQLAQDLGDLLQRELRIKSNQKLRQAYELGVKTEDISVGKSLLPEWNIRDTVDPEDLTLSESDETLRGSTSGEDTQETQQHALATTPEPVETTVSQPSDPEDPAWFKDVAPKHMYDSDGEENEDNEYDDIYMNNHVSAQPFYDENGHSNIVHDVEIVGGSGQVVNVDLEVYLAVDDEEFDDLPEVELAINKNAFEKEFGDQGAVDVYVPDMKMFCLDRFEEGEEHVRDADQEENENVILPEGPLQNVEPDNGDDMESGDEQLDSMEVYEFGSGSSDSEMYSEEE